MRRPVLAAFIVVMASTRAIAGDCDGCMPERMCIRHQKEQDETMKEFMKFRKDKDPMKRVEVLQKLGHLNDAHMNHRSRDLASAIGDMMLDLDIGVRSEALKFLTTNQEPKTAFDEIGKAFDKMLPKISKSKPAGESAAAQAAALQYEERTTLACACLTGMANIGGKGTADHFIDALKTDNLTLIEEACRISTSVHSAKLVETYLEIYSANCPPKDEESKKHICQSAAAAFAAQSVFAEVLADDYATWLKKARAWWKTQEAVYDPPKEPDAPK